MADHRARPSVIVRRRATERHRRSAVPPDADAVRRRRHVRRALQRRLLVRDVCAGRLVSRRRPARCTPTRTSWTASPSLARGGEQRAVRCSRALRPRHTELEVGPLRLEILRPMERLRLTLSESPDRRGLRARLRAPAAAVPRGAVPPPALRPGDQRHGALHAGVPRRRARSVRRRGRRGRRLARDARPLVGHPLDDGPAHAARRRRPDPRGGRPPPLPAVGAVRDVATTAASSTRTRTSTATRWTSRGS